MTTTSADSAFPTRWGAYRLERLLGRGGMGEVFLAWDGRLERHVAIKRIRTDPPPGEDAKARFRREARAVARLSHPAIVQVFDLLEADDGDGLVMEYVEGRGLAEVVADGRLDVDEVVRLGAEIADGLAEAHSKGLVHRDLKPQNVRVTPSGRAKILDFGLARLLWSEGLDLEALDRARTRDGVLIGTVHAMSPEQASGRPVDHRSDLFALGGLLYEMLGGRAPFRGDNVLDTLRRVTGEQPESLAVVRPELPSALVALVADLLAKEPDDRPQNARLVVDALDALRGRELGGVASPGPPTRPTPTARPAVDAEARATGEWPAAALDGSSLETAVRTLVATELVEHRELLEALGDVAAAEILGRHDRVLRDLVARHAGVEIDKGSGFLVLFERPISAVDFALEVQRRTAELAASTPELRFDLSTRIGIHLGEVQLQHNSPRDVALGAKALDVEGRARTLAVALARLAGSRQTLLSHSAFEVARRAADGDDRSRDAVRWLAHGDYQLDDLADPLAIYEVGAADFAPLAAPDDEADARRIVSQADERLLGWRPAPGQIVPRRPSWRLDRRLGEGGFGEVWLADHESGERRVFKFCFEASKLRALQREVTLFHVLKETLGHRRDIARVLDWSFEAAPFFVESEHTEGGDLATWADRQGGVDALPLATRVDLVAQVADALAAAHSVGILHKDVRPQNILVTETPAGPPRIRLTDFGLAEWVDQSRLADSGQVPGTGFAESLDDGPSTIGSRRYLAPERLEGRPAAVQADLFALGVLLFQLVVGDLTRALAPSWRREVDDPLLADDIAWLVDGSPERRPASAAPVAERLRALDARRLERRDAARAAARGRRWRGLALAGSMLSVLVLAMLVQAQGARHEAERLRGRADAARQQAETLIGFMLGDLREPLRSVGRLDALEGAGEKALAYFDGLDAADLGTRSSTNHVSALRQMGDVRLAQGDLDAAQALFERSLAGGRELFERDPTDGALFALGQGRLGLATVHRRRGDADAALVDATAYLDRARELSNRDPNDGDRWLDVASGHDLVAELLLARHNPPLALEHYRDSLAVVERWVALEPSRPDRHDRLASAHLKIAEVAYDQGQLADATAATDRAIEVLEALVADQPAETRQRQHKRLALAHDRAGDYRLDLGELDAVDRHRRRHLELAEALRRTDPDAVEWRVLRVDGLVARAELLGFSGAPARAEAALLAALDLADSLAIDDGLSRRTRAEVRTALAEHRLRQGRFDAARREAGRAVTLLAARFEPSDRREIRVAARAHLVAGEALAALGRPVDAEASWRQALDLLDARWAGGESATAPPDLLLVARIHRLLGRRQEAEAALFTLLGMGVRHPRLLACCGDDLAPEMSSRRPPGR